MAVKGKERRGARESERSERGRERNTDPKPL
jgi:hypothetical protein